MKIKLSTFLVIVLLAALCVVGFMANKYYRDSSELGQFKKDYAVLQKSADSVIKINQLKQKSIDLLSDSVKAADSIIQIQKNKTSILLKDRNQLKTEVSELEKKLLDSTGTQITDTSKILVIKDGIISKLKTDVAKADAIIVSKDSIISIKDIQIAQIQKQVKLVSEQRDDLQKIVDNLPKAPRDPNKFIGIPLPSRKLSFIIGAITGAVVISKVTN